MPPREPAHATTPSPGGLGALDSWPMSMSGQRTVDGAWWGCSGLLALAILGLSLGSPPDVPGFRFVAADKVGHVFAYGLLTGSLLLAAVWRPGRDRGVSKGPWPIVAGVIAFGGIIELIQSRAGRSAEFVDLAADAVGVCLAAGIWLWLRRRRSHAAPAPKRPAGPSAGPGGA